jgi:hypothetical protein
LRKREKKKIVLSRMSRGGSNAARFDGLVALGQSISTSPHWVKQILVVQGVFIALNAILTVLGACNGSFAFAGTAFTLMTFHFLVFAVSHHAPKLDANAVLARYYNNNVFPSLELLKAALLCAQFLASIVLASIASVWIVAISIHVDAISGFQCGAFVLGRDYQHDCRPDTPILFVCLYFCDVHVCDSVYVALLGSRRSIWLYSCLVGGNVLSRNTSRFQLVSKFGTISNCNEQHCAVQLQHIDKGRTSVWAGSSTVLAAFCGDVDAQIGLLEFWSRDVWR